MLGEESAGASFESRADVVIFATNRDGQQSSRRDDEQLHRKSTTTQSD